MTTMTCTVNGLFSTGEDFDDEDLLGTDWAVDSVCGAASVAAAVSPCPLRAPSVPLCTEQQDRRSLQLQAAQGSAAPCNSSASSAGQTVTSGLRQISSSSSSSLAPVQDSSLNNPKQQQSDTTADKLQDPGLAQDDFDDWDIDLADLDECEQQIGKPLQPPAPSPPGPTAESVSSAKCLRPPTGGGTGSLPSRSLRELSTASRVPDSSRHNLPHQASSTLPLRSPNPRPAFHPAPPQSPSVFPGFTASSPIPSPVSRTVRGPQQPQTPQATPGPSPRGRALFNSVCPSPSSVSSPGLSPYPLHRPILTNHLVQLVSNSNKLPRRRTRSDTHRPRTRRFPGPAGLLPQQPQGQSLDDIVVSVPLTPAHGAVARLPSQGPSSQSEEDEFSSGPWAAMKAEMGLDERNPSCFLHSYSVAMVLRKAALKQLERNKVPNMAVQLKSILHTHSDAKAVFRDPTGEIQGTVHRRLLEDRLGELKVGAVLLLKQVGVFSPSHRNHYLNVTSNNLLRLYGPDGAAPSSTPLSSTPLPPFALELALPSPIRCPAAPGEPVSWMQLMFDEEEEGLGEGGKCTGGGEAPRMPAGSRANRGPAGNQAPQHSGWDADDDLDELLSELPEEACNL
ncbi:uncharacterized protein hrob [Genypterus blacodes]|uniref:uncharacterized protein hrob n=1 Tax=Genypterus blacodes TaxID=154954 RepID=UPI003F768089